MKVSLKERLLAYMRRNHTVWVASGELQRLVVAHTDYTPRTAVRRLEELAEDGDLEVEYRKGHAWYRAKQRMSVQEMLTISKHNVAAFDRA